MSVSCKTERSLLSHEDNELVSKTHAPAIYALTRAELEEVRHRLRSIRGRESTLARQKQREVRGKADPRGGSFPGTAEYPKRRKQLFANALKRVNREFHRLRKIEGRKMLTASAQRALALRRAGEEFRRPEQEVAPSANPGLRSTSNKKARQIVSGRRVGSVSQATKRAQASRDRPSASADA